MILLSQHLAERPLTFSSHVWASVIYIPKEFLFLHVSFNRYLVQESHYLQETVPVGKKLRCRTLNWFKENCKDGMEIRNKLNKPEEIIIEKTGELWPHLL